MAHGPVMAGRYWPAEYLAPVPPVRLLVPSRAFTPTAEHVAEADARMARVTHPGARDVVTLQVLGQAVEEIGRHHAGHPPACDVCHWLSQAVAAYRALGQTA